MGLFSSRPSGQDARILRASKLERMEMLDRKPGRTRADTRAANRLARQSNRLLFRSR